MPSGPWHCHDCGVSNIENVSECIFCFHFKCSECPYYDLRTGAVYYMLERQDAQDTSRVHTSTVGMTPMNLLLEPLDWNGEDDKGGGNNKDAKKKTEIAVADNKDGSESKRT